MNNYQPGVHKLAHHLKHLQKIVNQEVVGPIHISVWPNSICNFSCSYCCGKNVKDRTQELSFDQYTKAIDVLHKYGLLAVELSGICGEPLLWKNFSKAIDYNYDKGLKSSLITNGIFLKKLSDTTLSKLSWIRVSIQNLNHIKLIDFNSISKKVKISMSYVVANQKSLDSLQSIWYYAHENNIIVRVAVARPCSQEWEQKVLNKVVILGEPLFFSQKEIGTPLGCYMPWIRPALDWKGHFLPCPSISLNEENEGYIPDNFILCDIDHLEEWILKNQAHDLGHRCKYCHCGKQENDFIFNLLNPPEDVNFV
jgi:organic radical activating enzyme